MKTLERNQLLKYIEHAIKLESSIVAQEQIIDSYYKASEAKKPIRKFFQMNIRKKMGDMSIAILTSMGSGEAFIVGS